MEILKYKGYEGTAELDMSIYVFAFFFLLSLQINPELLDFAAWLARYKNEIPLE